MEFFNEEVNRSLVKNIDPDKFVYIAKIKDEETGELRDATDEEKNNPNIICKEYLCTKSDGKIVTKDIYDAAIKEKTGMSPEEFYEKHITRNSKDEEKKDDESDESNSDDEKSEENNDSNPDEEESKGSPDSNNENDEDYESKDINGGETKDAEHYKNDDDKPKDDGLTPENGVDVDNGMSPQEQEEREKNVEDNSENKSDDDESTYDTDTKDNKDNSDLITGYKIPENVTTDGITSPFVGMLNNLVATTNSKPTNENFDKLIEKLDSYVNKTTSDREAKQFIMQFMKDTLSSLKVSNDGITRNNLLKVANQFYEGIKEEYKRGLNTPKNNVNNNSGNSNDKVTNPLLATKKTDEKKNVSEDVVMTPSRSNSIEIAKLKKKKKEKRNSKKGVRVIFEKK